MLHPLHDIIKSIQPVDISLEPAAQAHLDDLTKPLGSLGRLEELAMRLYCIQGGNRPLAADPARIYTVAGDHGVSLEGVSPFPQEVTRQMVMNFLNNGAGINVLCNTVGCEQFVVDAGSCGGAYPEHPRLIQRKIGAGTANLAKGPAMSREHCEQAVMLGIDLARMAHESGCRTVGTGEMGISNTTPSTALYCAYLGIDPADITGPGAGITPEGVVRKTDIIRTGLAVNSKAVDSGDTLDILAALGGYEIATLTGLILGGAYYRMAVLVDGFISTAAWVAAWKLCPAVADYSFFSHASAETGHKAALKMLGIKPLHDLGLRLGEGTGAALTLFLLRSAAAIFNDMATFSTAGVAGSEIV
ncbi:nicotinate-nucleotide--dimethylbenzimidazole phosphoribosyltransferase [Oleidesulfovibrio sp.]|uniref:nicotinate-nucleotide--dimethylbenzimidazole phosphoribosyltransferase n=1 Tax=Oleidesulfovibrio sp. TaxID=2909707 RepID=UPI003A87B66C